MATTVVKPASQTPIRTLDAFSVLRQEMEDLFSKFWDGNREKWLNASFSPMSDLIETDNAYELKMDVPGMEAKDIDVQVHGNTITLSGKRHEEKEEKGKTFHRMERYSGSFSRMFTLPCEVNEDEVAAEYVQGVLTVKLPKCENNDAKKIAVKG